MKSVCDITECTSHGRRRGLCDRHYAQWLRTVPPTWQGPLDCQCETPTPTPTDMCARCLRIIAELVHARRRDDR